MVLKKELGVHIIVDFKECDESKLKFVDDIKDVFIDAARLSKATILDSKFHQFDPFGVSGIVLLAESHFSIHTYPEDKFVAFDVFTCGNMQPQKTIDELKKYFCAKDIVVHEFKRGV